VIGYFPAHPRLDVEGFNARHGVTDIQREAMEIGSCFGWEVPGADPDYLDEQQRKKAVES
jgi:hypothetical protein